MWQLKEWLTQRSCDLYVSRLFVLRTASDGAGKARRPVGLADDYIGSLYRSRLFVLRTASDGAGKARRPVGLADDYIGVLFPFDYLAGNKNNRCTHRQA